MYPRLLHLGPVTVTTYGALAALGLVCALLLAERGAPKRGLLPESVWNTCLFAMVGTVVISRGILIYESLRAFRKYPLLVLTLPTVTKFGAVACVLCVVGYAAWKKMPLLKLADVLAPAAALLAAFLHLGDVMAGNDLGATTLSRWGRLLPSMRGAGVYSAMGTYPVALVAAVICALTAVVAWRMLLRPVQAGTVAGVTLLVAASQRYVLNLFRPSDVNAEPVAITAQGFVLLGLIACSGILLLQRKKSVHAL